MDDIFDMFFYEDKENSSNSYYSRKLENIDNEKFTIYGLVYTDTNNTYLEKVAIYNPETKDWTFIREFKKKKSNWFTRIIEKIKRFFIEIFY